VIGVRISIRAARRIFSILIGTVQSTLGGVAITVGYFLYSDYFGVRASLRVPAESLPFYMLILTVFGFFSIISGSFLLTERVESPQTEDRKS
jgi:hypothetical protein